MKYDVTSFCQCPDCGGDLREVNEVLQCEKCMKAYEVCNGIPILLPDYEDDRQKRFIHCCRDMAVSDMKKPMEPWRKYRHTMLLKFIGDSPGRRVLDIGSSHGLYLARIKADVKVALDIALPYLEAIPDSSDIIRICGDAEYLPFKPGAFDVIIVSDSLEHLLNPGNFIKRLESVCNKDTRLIVHVPWEENLESYINYKEFEFTHLRQLNAFTFCDFFRNFTIKRRMKTYPNLNIPFVFTLFNKLPLFIVNRLLSRYFFSPGNKENDYNWRINRLNILPKGEWWLFRFFKPYFMMFELRLRK